MPRATAPERGLRERKKQRTRELIGESARRLFVEHGFEHVTIAEIARLAEVSEQTVFNYFPTKEDLVFWRLQSFEEELIDAIREKGAGESIIDAFGRFVTKQRGLLAQPDPEARKRLLEVTRMITESPSLLRREREIFDRYTRSLAALVAEETGSRDEVTTWVIANALIGIHRGLVDYSRRRLVAGGQSARIQKEVRKRAEGALQALRDGLATVGAAKS